MLLATNRAMTSARCSGVNDALYGRIIPTVGERKLAAESFIDINLNADFIDIDDLVH